MLISRKQIQLTDIEEQELIPKIWEIWDKGRFVSKLTIAGNCLDAYNQEFSVPITGEDDWMQDLRVYIPVTSTSVDSLVSVHLNTIMPDPRYMDIDTEITGDFLTDVLLQNDADTQFEEETFKNAKQAGIIGDTYTLLNPKGPYVEAQAISFHDVRVYPLHTDLSKTNKIFVIRKGAYELETSPISYIGESVVKLDERADSTGHDNFARADNNIIDINNEYKRAEGQILGLGHVLLEAHIPVFNFKSTKRRAVNIIATIDYKTRMLVRYYEPQSEEEYQSKLIHTSWDRRLPGQPWGTGIVQPILSLQHFMNALFIRELADGYLSSFGGITYNSQDEITQQLIQYWEHRPGARWPVAPQTNLQPIPINSRDRSFTYQLLPMIQQYLVNQANAQTPVTGENSPVKFATQANIQYQASNQRTQSSATHWDNNYLRAIKYEQLKAIHSKWFKNIGTDPFTGQPRMLPNNQAIAWWMRKVGYDDMKIASKIYNPRFMAKLSMPIGFTDIKITGTKTTIDKADKANRFSVLMRDVYNSPEAQFVKVDKALEKRIALSDVGDPEDIVFTEDDRMQMMQQQQMQAQQAQMQQNQQQGQPGQPPMMPNQPPMLPNNQPQMNPGMAA